MDRHHVRVLAVGICVALAVALVVIVIRTNDSHDLVLKIEPISSTDAIVVYAGGAVATPGLYTLPAHARLASLIDQSGLQDNADQSSLNMAAELHDGEQVIVQVRASPTAPILANAGQTPQATPGTQENGTVDVNSATLEQLESLPGIGPALAQRILDYREANGPFATLDDLANVSGISARMVDGFRTVATAGP